MLKQDTITAISTASGEAGVALIRISGPEALKVAARIFRPQNESDVRRYAGYTVHYGRFVDSQDQGVDDGLLTVFRAPKSYTGEDTAELSCHGGRATTSRVLQLALQAGARLADPGEFTQRAFLNGRLDLAQAESVADVIRARTEASRRLARRQLDGALSRKVAGLKDELVGILAAIEVTIDFSDEVGDLEYAPLLERIQAVRAEVETLLATAERGRILREGLRVTIAGQPNVGKSSLLNALLRADRAIVTPVAGTTRDLLEESANIQGIPIVLVDTAGIRDTEDVVERIGVERAETAARDADVALIVLDVTQGYSQEDEQVVNRIVADRPPVLVYVLNKCDLIDSARAQAAAESVRQNIPSEAEIVPVSARTGAGSAELEDAILRATEAGAQDGGTMDTVVVANVRHRQALESAHNSLMEAEQTTLKRLPGDFISIDVRGALDALGQITGETVTEEIIHRIFKDFCVGK